MPGRFVGRERELQLADDALDSAAAGRGSVLVLAGEAGIGKSRLAQEIVARAGTRQMQTAWSAGWPGGGAPAYWPWPELLDAVGCAPGPALDLASGAPDAERFDRFRTVGAALRQRAVERPLVLVVDDAHTIDPDGLLLTRFVARSLVGQALLLVVTHRTSPDIAPHAAAVLADIDREGFVLRLSGLAPAEVGDLLVDHGEPPAATVVERVQELTDGNPFLVGQVLDAELHRHDRPTPGAARRLLDAQLDALDAPTRSVLEAAAVLGRSATVPELARVADVDAVTIERVRDATADMGLVRSDRTAPLAFAHDLAREAVLARLDAEPLADLHRRCTELFAADDPLPEHAARRAQHALALAHYSSGDAAEGVAVARASARTLLERGAPEIAVELLQDALTVVDSADSATMAPLLTEVGYALLTTGRLADARDAFRRAVAAADASGAALTYAQAALGLGGVWVHDHRTAEENRAYRDVLDHAIAAIADDESPEARRLVASLRLRRAAELAAKGLGSDDDALAALDEVRAVGSPSEIATGLSLIHHLMLGPKYADTRVPVARELVEIARANGDELHLLLGLMWSAVDALLLGQDADRALGELRDRAEALGMRAIFFMSDAIDVMRLMRAGDLVAAEEAANACLERGLQVGDTDATNYYGTHLLALRWYAGRAGELLDLAQELAASTAIPDENPVFHAAIAAFAAEEGDVDLARRSIARAGGGRLDEVMQTSAWVVMMFALADAAVLLDDAELAAEVYEVLVPYARLPIMASIGVACFGSTERSLGLAARVTGRFDDAVAHLERAVAENQRLGNRPMTAIARADLAETLMARGRPEDRATAAELVAAAVDAAQRMDLDGRLRRWKQVRESIEMAEPPARRARCVRRNGEWVVESDDERALVPDSVGMGYLTTLLAAPRVEIAAGELAGIDLVARPQAVLDPEAVRSLRQRVRDLERQVDEATLAGHHEEAAARQEEIDEIVRHAGAAMGASGRARRFNDAAERARTAVQKAIRRAIGSIDRDAPRLGEALRASVRTGHRCCYEPAAGAPEAWDVQTG